MSMSTRRTLRFIHIVSTIWFIACIGYILVLRLHQAGFHWWVIFSLSGPSSLLVLILISLYLFALFRGVDKAQRIEVEHPLTTTSYYMILYVASPLWGGLAGMSGMAFGVDCLANFLLGVALGTLYVTFGVWVVVDPVAGLAEMLAPASRKHRLERLAHVEAERRTRQEKREQLLAEAFAREEQERQRWQQRLGPQAQKLAGLLARDSSDAARAEREAVAIGANAWRLGGLSCMRQLRDMTLALCGKAPDHDTVSDCLSTWWDGIGDWRRPSFR
ncbi:MAG: hypothetical protein KBE65_11165 [Phycisphaerae bacterium]|nr:hypothetical protein [Phycisphaerae bacterium]